MRRLVVMVILIAVLAMIIGSGLFAQASAPAASAAPAAVAAPPASSSVPPAGTKPVGVRPAPSILPTLRLINSEMLPTLGFLLNLTDDQKTKAQDLLSKSDEELKPSIAAQVKATSDYVALLGKQDASQADLTAAAQKVLAADSGLMAGRIKAFVAFKALLTPEQNKLLAQELQQTSSKWLPQTNVPAGPAPTPANGK